LAIVHTETLDGDTLLVKSSGFDESLEQVQAYGIAVIAACIRHGVTHVLCDDLDLEYRLGTVDTFQSAQFIAAQAPAVARVALVCNPKYIADARFWEDVAVNRGLTVRVFTEVEAARAWLRQGAA
jgi:hypothetical protein